MIEALENYLQILASRGSIRAALVGAAETVASRPWDVIRIATMLARCEVCVADADLGLTRQLHARAPDGQDVIVTVQQGQRYPRPAHTHRLARGAYDIPVDMARRLVWSAIAAAEGEVHTLLDPACGAGAFLLAAVEAGVPEVYGTCADETLLAIAEIAVPTARLLEEPALRHGPLVDVVVGSAPFVPPELQDPGLRRDLQRRFPWLKKRFDLVMPFASVAVQRVRPGGAAGLILPTHAMVESHGALIRRRWLQRHRIVDLSGPHPFPGDEVEVMMVVIGAGQRREPLPVYGIEPTELLQLKNVPLNPHLMPGDVDRVERVRQQSVFLRDVAEVEAGVVVHGPHSGLEMLIHDEPGEGRVPYAEAQEFFSGTRAWLTYDPENMHQPRHPELFERAKVVVQRTRGQGQIRAAIDWDGVYVDNSCTVVLPTTREITVERILELIRSPIVDSIRRVELGRRLDLYPGELQRIPVPRRWLTDPQISLQKAWGLDRADIERCLALAKT